MPQKQRYNEVSRFSQFRNNNLNFNNYEQLMIYIFNQGVFINPALVEPFGLTLIEVEFNRLANLVFLWYNAPFFFFFISKHDQTHAGSSTWASNGGH